MKISKSTPAKPRAVPVGCLAAKLLGRSRTAGTVSFTAREMAMAFPGFHAMELDNALNELIDKELLKQRGREDSATYSLTDRGRESRVVVD
jgi:molybdenum-dependent DNA-binding transcriptional regulator ModE